MIGAVDDALVRRPHRRRFGASRSGHAQRADTRGRDRAAAHRHERLAVRRLAGGLLPGGPPAARMARVLRRAVRHGRGEQLVLSPSRADHVRTVAGANTAGVRRHGEGQSIHHAPEAAARSRGARRAPLGASDRSRRSARSHPVPAPATVPGGDRAPAPAPERPSRRDGAPRSSSATRPGTQTMSSTCSTTPAQPWSGPTGPACDTRFR
jgi:hypothetical protein